MPNKLKNLIYNANHVDSDDSDPSSSDDDEIVYVKNKKKNSSKQESIHASPPATTEAKKTATTASTKEEEKKKKEAIDELPADGDWKDRIQFLMEKVEAMEKHNKAWMSEKEKKKPLKEEKEKTFRQLVEDYQSRSSRRQILNNIIDDKQKSLFQQVKF